MGETRMWDVRYVQKLQPLMITKAIVHQLVLDDQRIKVTEIADAMNMSKERVCHVLNQDLGMTMLSVLLLSIVQKRIRMKISNAFLMQFILAQLIRVWTQINYCK
ncbi:hypothetical protein NPIL_286731 [Nephila pilipes]|uniref:Uncharacterized protein n=1 Tax=Nephila pilipes TaxID=299642 RepID=A0A8X6R3S5_NEPPI|nr:hypothetical protein NPIL_286731 [Nephila pilipes]